MITEVGDVAEPGNACLIKIDVSSRSFEGLDKMASKKFFNHLGMKPTEFRSLIEV